MFQKINKKERLESIISIGVNKLFQRYEKEILSTSWLLGQDNLQGIQNTLPAFSTFIKKKPHLFNPYETMVEQQGILE